MTEMNTYLFTAKLAFVDTDPQDNASFFILHYPSTLSTVHYLYPL